MHGDFNPVVFILLSSGNTLQCVQVKLSSEGGSGFNSVYKIVPPQDIDRVTAEPSRLNSNQKISVSAS